MVRAAAAITLEHLFVEYFSPRRLLGTSRKTAIAYRTAVNRWNRFSQRNPIPIQKIDTTAFCAFHAHLLESCGVASANTYCSHLLVILRFAVEDEDLPMDRLPKWRKVKEPKRSPLAMTTEEFSSVLEESRQWPGMIEGCPAADWWTALLLVCWETGLRYSALLLLRSIDVVWDSGGLFCQGDTQKDKETMWFALPPHVLDAIRAIHDPARELLFPRRVTIDTVGRWFRAILDRSGIYAPHGCGMRFHRLRKSKASYTEVAGGDAQKALGHSSRAVTERYLDPRIVGTAKQPFMPPPLLYSSDRPRFRVYG